MHLPKYIAGFCCGFLLLFTGTNSFGQVKLPRLVSDGMVLQRDTKTNIWGWASAGEKVSLSFNGKTYETTTAADGKWKVALAPMPAGGPFTMQISGSNQVAVKNILLGDVWVCSGQSNMELPMERVKYKYPTEIAASENNQIRQFIVATRYNFKGPQEDLPSGTWESANPKSVLQFSAVGYFFAKELYQKYKVPIGLIRVSVGGSPAEAWLSADALKAFPEHQKMANLVKRNGYIDSVQKAENAATNAWYTRLQKQDKGIQEAKRWYNPTYDATDWNTMQVPGFWEEQGLPNTDGVVWFRKEIDVPANMVGKPAQLWLGRIVDRDSVYINGTFVGAITYQYPPRIYNVPATILKPGKNVIIARIMNGGGQGGFVKDKPYELIAGDQKIDLKGTWQYKLGATSSPIGGTTFFQYYPGGLYNALLAPLTQYAMKGVIWYQGESNAGKPQEYQTLFPAVIIDWRQKWNQGNFPFLFVQLANFMEAKKEPSESDWAATREAQLKTLALPKTAMAVTTDIGEWNDIHPLNKKDVGHRLALAAEKVAYNEPKVVFSGPIYKSMKVEGNKVILSFENVGSGLLAKGNSELKHFAIAGADKKFVWAKAKIEKDKVIVWSTQVAKPVAVRYAWADNPEGANLYNKEGLPASPFRTDK